MRIVHLPPSDQLKALKEDWLPMARQQLPLLTQNKHSLFKELVRAITEPDYFNLWAWIYIESSRAAIFSDNPRTIVYQFYLTHPYLVEQVMRARK
jgi:hypothetical protein